MQIYEELVAGGLATQVTNEEEVRKTVNEGKVVSYIGFDSTANSFHVGHSMVLCLAKRLQMAGNRPIALIGGNTGMIGDPSGRSDMRTMMTPEIIQHNCDCFKRQMNRFIDFSEDEALTINNVKWLLELNYINFLREVGPRFSINNILRAEYYKQRMEKGLSFLEFNYMIMQSPDFCELFQRYGCNMQFGGDDQWGNMLSGAELIRRKLDRNAYVMTITLLLNSEDKRMGKTQSDAIWLDSNKTSPFEFCQHRGNIADANVLKRLRMLTLLPIEQIGKMDRQEGSQLNKAKETLAYELTNPAHGEGKTARTQERAGTPFEFGGNTANMPIYQLTDEDFTDGTVGVSSVFQKSGLCASRSEARRNVEQGGASVDRNATKDIKVVFSKDQLVDEGLVFKRGKKNLMKVTIK